MTDPLPYAPHPSLLTSMHELATARGERANELLTHIQYALAKGADPNIVSKKGTTPLSMLAHVDRGSDWERLRSAVLSLMEHGANAWHEGPMGSRRCNPLVYMSTGAVVNNAAAGNVWAHLGMALMEGMAGQYDRGELPHHPQGSNPLHVVCEHGIELVPHAFQEGWVRADWIAQSNHQGETPLHCLWKPRETLRDLVEFNEGDRTIEALWQGTADLLNAGADARQPDPRGKTPVARIQHMIDKGLRQRGAWPVVSAALEAARLHAASPLAAARSGVPRL